MSQVSMNTGNSGLVMYNFNYLNIGFTGNIAGIIWLHTFVNDSEANLQYLR